MAYTTAPISLRKYRKPVRLTSTTRYQIGLVTGVGARGPGRTELFFIDPAHGRRVPSPHRKSFPTPDAAWEYLIEQGHVRPEYETRSRKFYETRRAKKRGRKTSHHSTK